jgi:dGTPase
MRRHGNHHLASYAMRVEESQGRRYPEPPHPFRNDYERDRDRIIHSRAFRRLENKTQVFTRRYSDHFRTRLTHTLEVAQISRTVAKALGLNSDLVEALALVHDVGIRPSATPGNPSSTASWRVTTKVLTTTCTRCALSSILSRNT